jgi:hypothetical protein
MLYSGLRDSYLTLFCTRCLVDVDTPQQWLTTVLVGILKRGKDPRDPDSYRTVGLESNLLKFFTWICDRRLRAWCNAYDILPPTQNEFCPRRRTVDNPFILRAAIE